MVHVKLDTLLIRAFQVLPLAQDKWLLDSYLNATGRIR